MKRTTTLAACAALGAAALAAMASASRDARGPVPFLAWKDAATAGLYHSPAPKKTCNVPLKSSVDGTPELIGNCILSRLGYGMYSTTATETGALTKIADTPAFNGSAVYVNGKYYGCDYEYNNSYELTSVKWYVYDTSTWHCESVTECALDYSHVATDRTYDATTGRVYSINYDKTGNSIWLATTSLTDGTPTYIAQLSKNVITIAAAPDGKLYGIDTEANLYQIGKNDASLSLIGNTAIFDDYISENTQSITIDQKTGKLYWAEFHIEGSFQPASALYEVNVANARTVKIKDLEGDPEIMGLYVADYTAAGVPAAPSALKAEPKAEGSLEYTFSFTAPTLTADGAALGSGAMTCELSVDDNLLDILEVTPGQKVTTGVQTLTRGLHTVKVTCENEVGTGECAVQMFFAGWDVPGAVDALKVNPQGAEAHISWSAPLSGAEGGAVRGPISYEITRSPGNHVIAPALNVTEFVDEVAEAGRYTYTVTAVSPDGKGDPLSAPAVVLGSFPIPYVCGFDNEEDFNLYTVVDVAGSGKVWNYDAENKRLRHPWSIDHNIDDYAVSPSLSMQKSKTYEISFDAYQMVESYPEHVELWFGASADPAQMTKVMDTQVLGTEPARFTALVVPSADGSNHFAFRSEGPKGGFMSYVDNVKVIEKGASDVPAMVSDLFVFGAPDGIEAIDLSFSAPRTDMQGTALASIDEISVMRDGEATAVKRFANPAPGATLSWRDSDCGAGAHSYSVTVRTSKGTSMAATGTAFAGIDVPLAPADVKFEGEPGALTVSWSAPACGKNGGNLTGITSYRVERFVNGSSQIITEGTDDTSISDTWESPVQAFVYYGVTAVTSAGESDMAVSTTYAAGDAYQLPFNESFAEGAPTNNPWSVEQAAGMQGSWEITASGQNPYCSAQDNDGGMATFDGYHSWTNGCELRLVSPAIDLSKWADPMLKFHLYHYNGQGWSETEPVNETMTVEVSADNAPFEKVAGADYATYASKNGWQEHTLDLSALKGTKNVRLGFRGKGAGCFNIHLDNISVTASTPYSGINLTEAVVFQMHTAKGALYWQNAANGISVYDAAGRLAYRSAASNGSINLSGGLYLVNSGKKTIKAIIH